MIYEFMNEATGEPKELHYRMGEAPMIGEIVELQGTRYRRVASCNIDAGLAAKVHGYPYVSNSLPRNLAGCETNKQGKPIISSTTHERNVMSQHGYVKD
jgi:hypothetical protein|tara:strand:- start:898 stop:1194 length:297 start_codon:yes stop_codon:yes gene_type:complete